MISISADINSLAKYLIKKSGLDSDVLSIERIYQGGNNQLFKVNCDNRALVIKKYFRGSGDYLNRLDSECTFFDVAKQRTPSYVPKLFYKCIHNDAALFEFIKGRKISSALEIESKHILQAAEFIKQLNNKNLKLDLTLKNATEACFSIQDHLKVIDSRLIELYQINNKSNEFSNTINRLNAKWSKVKKNSELNCKLNNIPLDKFLDFDKRIISPSDFGFHNAIINDADNLIFLDFEYAGWDDPAKLVGDFFSQISIPIPPNYFSIFIKNALNLHSENDVDYARISSLLNPYKIKWCCIALNIFLEKHLKRRCFSNPNLNIDAFKSEQIKKANTLMESILL